MKALVGILIQEKALVAAFSAITNLRVDLRFKLYLRPGAVHQHSPAPTSEVGVVEPAAPGSVVLAAPARRQTPAGEGEAPDVVPAAPAAPRPPAVTPTTAAVIARLSIVAPATVARTAAVAAVLSSLRGHSRVTNTDRGPVTRRVSNV